MHASMLRPVALPSHLMGRPAPCDLFDAKGTLLQKAGSPLSGRPEQALRRHRVFCEASKAHYLCSVNPLARLLSVRRALDDIDRRIGEGRAVAAAEVVELANAVHDAWHLDPDACIGHARLDGADRPSVSHAVLAALLTAELAAANGFSRDAATPLIGAALTMNLASMAMHDQLLALPEPPRFAPAPEQRLHPLDAAALLESLGEFPADWLLAVAQHHENVDGSGYPAALKGLQISLGARMLRIAESLARKLIGAKTRAPQHWNIAKTRHIDQLIQHVFAAELSRLDLTLVRQLMTRLGCFPPGTLVRLSNGELAVVNRRRSEDNAPPRETIAVLNARGRLLEAPRLRALGTRECRIQGYAHDELQRLPRYDWQRVWGYA